MARNIYDVSPSGSRWTVKKRGTLVSSGTFDRKDNAIQHGRSLALANQPSQLVVRLGNGQIELEWTYGNDPESSPG